MSLQTLPFVLTNEAKPLSNLCLVTLGLKPSSFAV